MKKSVNKLLLSSAEILIAKTINSQAKKIMPEQLVDIVNKHSKLAAGAGAVPVPGVDLVLGSAATTKMYKDINKMMAVESGSASLKSIVSSLMTSLAAKFTSSGLASSVKCIPGVGQIAGSMVGSITQYVFSLLSGYIYFNALSLLVDKKGHITLDRLGDAMVSSLNSEATQQFFEAIKENIVSIYESTKSGVTSVYTSATDGLSTAKEKSSAAISSVIGKAGETASSVSASMRGFFKKKKTKKDDKAEDS